MRMSPPSVPKPSGAWAIPHGAFRAPRIATFPSRIPVAASNESTKPKPGPCFSSLLFGCVFAYVTKTRLPIAWIPNGA